MISPTGQRIVSIYKQLDRDVIGDFFPKTFGYAWCKLCWWQLNEYASHQLVELIAHVPLAQSRDSVMISPNGTLESST